MNDVTAQWLEAGSRFTLDLVSCILVGELLLAAWLLPAGSDGTVHPRARAVLRRGPIWVLVWCLSAVGLAVASTVQLLRVPAGSLLDTRTVQVAWQLPQVRALCVIVLTGLALAFVLPRLRRILPTRLAMLAVLVALGTLTTTGHAGASASHFWAAESVLLHVGAVTVWVGGLMSVAARSRDRELLRVVLLPYSRVALVAFLLVAASGVLGALVRLGPPSSAWLSTYGVLVGVKAAVLLLVGVAGALHRRFTIPRALAGRTRSLARLAVVELAVLAAGSAVAVVLARTPVPVGALARVAPTHSEQFPTIDRMIEAPGWRLLVEGRGDAVVAALVVSLAVCYLGAVRSLVRRGGTWPGRRTVAFLAGSVLVLWCLVGGAAAYAAGDLGIYTARLVLLSVVAPVLLALGAPLTLVAASGGRPAASRHARVLLSPVNAAVLLVVLVSLLFSTPLLEISFRHPLLHGAVAVALLALGTTYAVAAVGPDARAGEADVRTPLLMCALTWFALSVHLFAGGRLVASQWFVDLGLYWGDPVGAQLRAAGFLAGGALVVTAAAVVLGRVDATRRTTAGAGAARGGTGPRPSSGGPLGSAEEEQQDHDHDEHERDQGDGASVHGSLPPMGVMPASWPGEPVDASSRSSSASSP